MPETSPHAPPGEPDGLSPGEQAILAALGGLSTRMAAIEARLDAVEQQAQAAVGAAGALGDTLDQRLAGLQAQGVDLDARGAALGRLGLAATDPAVTGLVERVLAELRQNTAAVEAALEGVKGLPGLVATAGDVVDQKLGALAAAGVDLDQRGADLLRLAERATRPEILRAVTVLVEKVNTLETLATSAVLEGQSVDMVGLAGRALVRTRDAHPEPAGAWQALRAVSDPDIQRALGFALHFGKLFGQALAR